LPFPGFRAFGARAISARVVGGNAVELRSHCRSTMKASLDSKAVSTISDWHALVSAHADAVWRYALTRSSCAAEASQRSQLAWLRLEQQTRLGRMPSDPRACLLAAVDGRDDADPWPAPRGDVGRDREWEAP
jgi:hypothetical protein